MDLSDARIIIKVTVIIPSKFYDKDNISVMICGQRLLLTKTGKVIYSPKLCDCVEYECECNVKFIKFPIYGQLLIDEDTMENIQLDALFSLWPFSSRFLVLKADICRKINDWYFYEASLNDGTLFITIDTLPIGG